MFKFDQDQFKSFYELHAKNMDFYEVNMLEARTVMKAVDVFEPQFILSSHYTNSGKPEFYFQQPVEIVKVVDLTIHHKGYDYIIIDNGEITYHKDSLDSVIYAMQIVKDYEKDGNYDAIKNIKAGKIKNNITYIDPTFDVKCSQI